jgi:hypothetical protein
MGRAPAAVVLASLDDDAISFRAVLGEGSAGGFALPWRQINAPHHTTAVAVAHRRDRRAVCRFGGHGRGDGDHHQPGPARRWGRHQSKLANDAVNGAKIQARSVAQSDEINPTLRYSVASNGTLITGDMGGSPQHVAGSNRYDLSFSSGDLGPNRLDTCAFAVSPRFDLTPAPGHNGHLNKRAYVNYARGSNTFQVFTFAQLADGSEIPDEAAFDVVVGC